MNEMKKLINNWRAYYINKRKNTIDNALKDEFNAFLLGLEYGALYSNDMKYYTKVCEIVEQYKREEK